MTSLRSPLGHARGLGSAKEGVAHWWAQRLTAVALVPLCLWFVISVIRLAGADLPVLQGWLASPGNAALMVLLILAVFHHAQLGLQVVIEDYVHCEAKKIVGIVAVKFLAAVLAVFLVLSVIKIGFGV
ncbi:MAG: succinate dehydrogenase, hydrophobic membrane anchor protein [Rhodospirillales bacterium]|nr:succinate dehydrogenase, hydrophobic membrane anchor protein [Rhodospirillales bacterium]